MAQIIVSKFGKVDKKEVDRIIKIMEKSYDRLWPHQVSLVDLYVFNRSSSVDAFVNKESKEVGVVSAPFDELFFAMHDAWHGIPRIIVCLERIKKLPKLVQVGGIRHEVGHSVLHGSLDYYLLPLPPVLGCLTKRFDISLQYVTNLLYLISISVKDYEVSRLLHERGYVKDQVAYAKHILAVTESDLLSWELASGKPLAEILFLTSCLKITGCAAALLCNDTFREEIKSCLMESLSYLPSDHSKPLLKVILEGFSSLGTDTFSNIDQMACLVSENLIKPLLKSWEVVVSNGT